MTWFASNGIPVWGEQQHYIGVGDTIKPASQTCASRSQAALRASLSFVRRRTERVQFLVRYSQTRF
jgi:hypothetical protein